MSSTFSSLERMAAGPSPLQGRTGARLLTRRRTLFAALCGASMLALMGLMLTAMARNGIMAVEIVLLVLFTVTLPWLVIGFWNAVIGLCLMRFSRDPATAVNPMLAHDDASVAITARTAILVCLRNEAMDGVARSLETMLEGLMREGALGHFHLYLLSDSSWNDEIRAEEALIASLQGRWGDDIAITYRRRENNHAFKAGNIRDFLDRWGADHDFALVLDADSYMSAPAILRLVRLMQANERLGIAQSLVVGLPTASAFARIFQYGMRLGMRSHTLGSAWWQGECGPYWGHNALIRLKPFAEHCALPEIGGGGPLAGPILSHDQVEAVLMRRAGYAVRAVPDEHGSFEQNPPDLIEFIRRDLRWCHGNMQYLKLLGLKGLQPVSRMQLVLAILMFAGSPAWVAFMLVSAGIVALSPDPAANFDPALGAALFIAVMGMVFAPKFATVADILGTGERRRAFGGAPRILASLLGEIVFSMLLAPIIAIAHTVFLAGLALGRRGNWPAQRRALQSIPVGQAIRRLWPQLVFGVAGMGWLAANAGLVVLPALAVILGPLLAVPFALLSASAMLGRLARASGLWCLPEESAPPPDLMRLGLPALPGSSATAQPVPAFVEAPVTARSEAGS